MFPTCFVLLCQKKNITESTVFRCSCGLCIETRRTAPSPAFPKVVFNELGKGLEHKYARLGHNTKSLLRIDVWVSCCNSACPYIRNYTKIKISCIHLYNASTANRSNHCNLHGVCNPSLSVQEASWQGLSFSLANPPNWSSWAKHTSGHKHVFYNTQSSNMFKNKLIMAIFLPDLPPPRSYFRLFFQRGYLEHSRTPFCKMQYIFWVHDLPLAHLKRTCLARAIESMLQLVQKRGLFSLCSM